MFSANRWETVDKLLGELNSGVDVVCDRYAYSGIAYSAAKGLDLEWCRAPDKGLPEPDLVLYLSVSAEVARTRGGYGEERYEKEEFQAQVGKQFVSLGQAEASRWKLINADRESSVIANEVLQHSLSIPKEWLQSSPGKLWVPRMEAVKKPIAHTMPIEVTPSLTLRAMESSTFGSLSIHSEEPVIPRIFSSVGDITAGNRVWVRARLHAVRKQGSKLAFLVLRENLKTVQAVVAVSPEMAKFAGSLPKESVVDVFGQVTVPPEPLRTCTQSNVEIAVEKIFCVSRADPLPIQLEDLSRSEGELALNSNAIRVHLETRLANRVVDLRTPANQAIMRIQSAVCTLFREFLLGKNFVEIHTPKLLATASEGGSTVFELKYFDRVAYLAQSPQFYKQMALMGDLPGVFEIGPVFRSENSLTHRHMTEFVGLDLELPFKEHYSEVLDVMDALFNHIFMSLAAQFGNEIDAVREQHPFEDLKWSYPSLKLEFKDAVKLLVDHGPAVIQADIDFIDKEIKSLPVGPESEESRRKLEKRKSELAAHMESVKIHKENEDMGTSDEKVLGRVVRAIHDTDFYMVTRFPVEIRPFYTMPCPDDPRWTNSYDIFLRGEEIVSGAQRIHDPALLLEVAKSKGVDLAPVQSYVDAFKYGAFPHGGGGVGLERVVMLFLNLPNIRQASMFPRDPNRLTP